MRRGVFIVVAFALISTAAAGCGSSTKAVSAKTTTTVESAETRQWVAAASQGMMSSSDNAPNMTSADATCMAHAIVDTITVAKLKAAGATLAGLRDPNGNPPASLSRSLPVNTKLALGSALQACGLGRLVGPALASGIADSSAKGFKLSPHSVTCVSDAFGNPSYRLFIAELTLSGSHMNATASTDFADLVIGCLDWAAIFSAQAKFPFSASESACINRSVRNDATFKNALASEIAGKQSSTSDAALAGPLLACLTPAHLAQLGKSAS